MSSEHIFFLLAHQDDELSVAPLIANAKNRGDSVSVIYLTDGGDGAASPSARNTESCRALKKLGVDVDREMITLGTDLRIPDGHLYRHLSRAHQALLEHARSGLSVTKIYSHSWEGGHQDHDAAVVVAVVLAWALGIPDEVYQIPFYRASNGARLPTVVFAPLPANGKVTWEPIGRLKRMRHLALVRYFPTQKHAFLRLLPVMFIDCLLNSTIPVQKVKAARLGERPVQGPLLYERRRWAHYTDIEEAARTHMAVHLLRMQRTGSCRIP